MKKGLIVINGFGVAEGVNHQVKRLKEEFIKQNVNINVSKNTEILTYLKNGEIALNLPKYDFIIYLDKDRYVAKMLENMGYKIFNSPASIVLCDDKMLTHIALSNKGINMPVTISSLLCYKDNGNRDYLNKIISILGFPLIVKENFGSLGKQVYLINNYQELINIENKLISVPHIFQKFISSSKGKDYRVIVVGGKVIASMKRENKNSYLSNLATGGIASKINLPDEYIKTAELCAKTLNLDYCGVDILEGEHGEPIVSEVNSNAFYEGIEKTTGINVAKAFVVHILKNI